MKTRTDVLPASIYAIIHYLCAAKAVFGFLKNIVKMVVIRQRENAGSYFLQVFSFSSINFAESAFFGEKNFAKSAVLSKKNFAISVKSSKSLFFLIVVL